MTPRVLFADGQVYIEGKPLRFVTVLDGRGDVYYRAETDEIYLVDELHTKIKAVIPADDLLKNPKRLSNGAVVTLILRKIGKLNSDEVLYETVKEWRVVKNKYTFRILDSELADAYEYGGDPIEAIYNFLSSIGLTKCAEIFAEYLDPESK